MKKSLVAALGLVLALGVSSVARADECAVNSVPVPPIDLASALEFGGALPGQLAGVPFSVVSLESQTLTWPGCGQECTFVQFQGTSRCGDLVATPIDYASLVQHPLAQPELFSAVGADQAGDGRWTVLAQSFLSETFDPIGGGAGFAFELGTREVIDVTSSGTAPLPLEIGVRAGVSVPVQVCENGLFRWIPVRELRFRASERLPSSSPTDLVDTVFYDQFISVDDVYPVAVTPGATLTLELYLRATANAVGAVDTFGNLCNGGFSYFDMDPGIAFTGSAGSIPFQGIQLQLSPDPALALTPRSGIAYAPVPEPGAIASAAIACGMLAVARRRI